MSNGQPVERTTLVGASALHGVSGTTGSHLGSTLRPGRAVLTRGVSRRSGSVACIHADASPTEVLAHPSWHRKRCRSTIVKRCWKRICGHPRVSADQNANGEAPSGVARRREHTTFGRRGLGSTVCPPHCRITESQQPLTGCTPRRGNRRRGCATCEVRCLRPEPHRNAPTR